MKKFFYLIFLISCSFIYGQDDLVTISGYVINQKTQLPMQGVTVINLNQVKGTTTNQLGNFQIQAQVNDSLHITYIGFDPLKVKVTNQWIRTKITTIELIEKSILIEEIHITGIKLTGFLEVDTKIIPKNEEYRYSISGLSHGYEGGRRSSKSFSRVMNAITNPADLIYNTFGKKPKELARLKEIKKDKTLRELLDNKYDRETLAAFLGLTKKEIEEILSNCNYSDTFIKTANDLQIIDAINGCYEEYKLMNRNKK